MASRKTLTVRVVGGVGNQLFCYFAGLAVSLLRDADLVVDVTDVRSGKGVHDSTLESYSLPGIFVAQALTRNPLKDFILKLKMRSKVVLPFVYRNTENYHSSTVGFDPEVLDTNSKFESISGYFQSYKYHDLCKILDKRPPLKNPSTWYVNHLQEILSSDITAVHIRRGDYVKHGKSHGLLGPLYYREAIELVSSKIPTKEFWVFSDDIEQAKKLLEQINARFRYVDPSPAHDAAESLLLMSHARAIIIANSTFSWWSAKFASDDTIIVAPSKWFRGMEDPTFLYPSSWFLAKSSWVIS